MVNLYAVLGVPDNATQLEIGEAHMRLTQRPLSDGRSRDRKLVSGPPNSIVSFKI